MPRTPNNGNNSTDDLVAELTDAAYRVALKHGFKGTFIDVQLELWAALRGVVLRELFLPDLVGLCSSGRSSSPYRLRSETVA